MAKENIRRVKLHSRHRQVNRSWRSCWYKAVPWLNVSGAWLEKAGFKAGNQIEITIENNLLTIKNCTSDGDTRN